nr:dihydrofolate reductase family protein [Streptomyces sp. HNM0574]
MEHDLVDELRLMTCPVVLGAPGGRAFGETGARKPMRLTCTRTVGDGLLLTTCRPARDTG